MPYIKKAQWDQIQKQLQGKGRFASDESDRFADLKDAIQKDSRMVSATTIGQALLNKICIPYNCRENAFVMEQGESIRVQPFRLVDQRFNIVSKKIIMRVLRETKVDEIQWTEETYDCDDIARKFVTRCADLGLNSIGRIISWSGGHAFCIAVIQDNDDIDFVFIEPQTDKLVQVGRGKYSLENALIVIS